MLLPLIIQNNLSSGGQVYSQNFVGSAASSGVLARSTLKVFAGVVSSASSLVSQVSAFVYRKTVIVHVELSRAPMFEIAILGE